MNAFDLESPVLSLNDLAKRTKLNKTTILRIVASLEKYDYVRRLGEGRYALGPQTLHLGSIYQRSLRLSEVVIPIMSDLVESTGETAAFFVRNKEQRVCLFMIESTRTLRSHIREGDVMPLRPSGTGKVLEAFADPPLNNEEHVEVRRVGYAINIGERNAEIASVSAPVFRNGSQLAGAISVSGHISHFTGERILDIAKAVTNAAGLISYQLGGQAFSPSD